MNKGVLQKMKHITVSDFYKKIIQKDILKPLILTIAIILLLVFSTLVYVGKETGGNINWLMLPSDMFGVPEKIETELGITPIYIGGAIVVGMDNFIIPSPMIYSG